MAESIVNPKASCRARSISLPSRSHPLAVNVENVLYRLKASEATLSSSSSICHKLDGLRNLYECFNEFLELPLTLQALSQDQHSKWAEEALDGSLRMLDVCGTTRDVLVQMREYIQDLELSLRRRSGDSDFTNEVGSYMTSRKTINKMVAKCIVNLKKVDKACSIELLDKDSSLVSIVSMFREVEAISHSVLKSLLSYASSPKTRSKQSGWSLVSKLMQQRRISCEEGASANEVDEIDAALQALSSRKLSKEGKTVQVQDLMKQLGTLEMTVQELEEGLEPIFRCLLKTRVCLLNALGH